MPGQSDIYNSRNYSILLNSRRSRKDSESTTVEIILYYLTSTSVILLVQIYNSRNYSILLNIADLIVPGKSTTVEIILYYLTEFADCEGIESTTVEIILYYLTFRQLKPRLYLQQ